MEPARKTLSANVVKKVIQLRRMISASFRDHPDMVIDADGRINIGAFPDNPLDDRLKHFEHKSLASLKVSVEALSLKVQPFPRLSLKER